MQVVNSFKHLSNGLRGVSLRESSLFTDSIEQFSPGRQLSDDVVFVLEIISRCLPCHSIIPYPRLKPIHKLDNMGMLHPLQHL